MHRLNHHLKTPSQYPYYNYYIKTQARLTKNKKGPFICDIRPELTKDSYGGLAANFPNWQFERINSVIQTIRQIVKAEGFGNS